MCGIAGIISTNKNLVNEHQLKKMADAIAHRGPDGEGFFISPKGNTGLAHRRLAIIDLTSNAAQPMHFLQRYSIVYNGEIYNYKELKINLQKSGYNFKNESDTEVVLAAYDFYKKDCVHHFDGMFAFTIWDEEEQILFCTRDSFGEKPFYYHITNEAFYFASEMKALWAIGIEKIMDETMAAVYLGIGQVQNAKDKSATFFKNVYALPAAHFATYNVKNNEFITQQYFDIDKEKQIEIIEKEASEKILHLLETSVNKRLRSDVEVGSSLSGGIDSSTIAYFVSKQNEVQNFKTFSAVFPGFDKDESIFIQELCRNLKIENNVVTPSANGLVNDFEKIACHQEEPFSSASIFAQYKVYELAKAYNVKVLLDGQGADEVFSGYTKYIHWLLQEVFKNKDVNIYKKEKDAFVKNNVSFNWSIKNIAASYLPSFSSNSLEKKAKQQILQNKFLNKDLLESINISTKIYKPTVTKLNDILYHNTMQLGLEELLRYADRNSMAHGVEVRLPFLQKELVQYIFSLPTTLKMHNGFTKYILRSSMQNKIPNKVLWNPIKTGFEPPQKTWMENRQLQEMIQEAKKKLVQNKILNTSILDMAITPTSAHEESNLDWRVLSLGTIMK